MFLPGRVFGRNVQRVEIVPVAFDLRTLGHGKAHIGENRSQFLHHLADRMDGADTAGPRGEGDIQPFRAQAFVQRDIAQSDLFGAQCRVNLILQQVQQGPGGAALIGFHLAKARHQGGNLTLLAQGGDTQILQPGLVRDIGHGGQVFGLQRV